MSERLRISVLGFIGRLPLAGVTSHFLQFVLGLHRLGHDVFYIEDDGSTPFDPVNETRTMDLTYTFEYMARHFEPFGLGDRWTYMDADGNYLGPMSKARAHEVLRTSDVLLNVSAGNILREEHLHPPARVLIDADPPYLQIWAEQGFQDTVEFLAQHTTLLTFAENFGKPGCRVPSGGFDWQTTRQPVVLHLWPFVFKPDAVALTTVMNWRIARDTEYQGEVYGQKDQEFRKFIRLPGRTSQILDIGMGHPKAPRDLLRQKGWRLHDPFPPTRDLWTYQSYLANSRGEFSVAKNAYVRPWSGWFSERSTCYMATGKPVVLQDTGFSEWLPTGEGVLSFTTLDEAVEAIEEMNADYERHCKAARRLVEEHFNSDDVLRDLLAKAGSG